MGGWNSHAYFATSSVAFNHAQYTTRSLGDKDIVIFVLSSAGRGVQNYIDCQHYHISQKDIQGPGPK